MRFEEFGYLSKGGRKHHAVNLDGLSLCSKRFDLLCALDTEDPIILADHWVLDEDFCHVCYDFLFTKTDYGKPPHQWRHFPDAWIIVKRGTEY